MEVALRGLCQANGLLWIHITETFVEKTDFLNIIVTIICSISALQHLVSV